MGSEKVVFNEILKSPEFNNFKLYLTKMQESIENRNIVEFVDSINRLNIANQDVISKANRSQSLILKKIFRDSDELRDVIFFQLDKDSTFEIGFENYIPSYFNPKTKKYCSLNLNLGKIDFSNKKVLLYNIQDSFKEPIKIQKNYLLSQKVKIDKLSFQIEELYKGLTSPKKTAKYIYDKEKNIHTYIKILLNKKHFQEYKDILKSRLKIKKEELKILEEELNKDREYIYEDVFFKMLKAQKFLEEVLEKEYFEIKHENKN